VLSWIQVELTDDFLRENLVVPIQETKKSKTGNQYDCSFESFKEGDGTKGFMGDGRHEPIK
jgi:hypothetical protein